MLLAQYDIILPTLGFQDWAKRGWMADALLFINQSYDLTK